MFAPERRLHQLTMAGALTLAMATARLTADVRIDGDSLTRLPNGQTVNSLLTINGHLVSMAGTEVDRGGVSSHYCV